MSYVIKINNCRRGFNNKSKIIKVIKNVQFIQLIKQELKKKE